MSDCAHTSTVEREGDTWTDRFGHPHVVIYTKCVQCRKTVRCRVEGEGTPVIYMPPFVPGGKP